MRAIWSAIKMLIMAIWSLSNILLAMLAFLFTWSTRVAVWFAKYTWAPMVHVIFGMKNQASIRTEIDPNEPYVIMANHASFLDIPVLLKELDIPLYFVAKKELKKVPFLGWFISMAGMIWIDRSNRAKATESIDKAAELIQAGRNVVIFPEGTASRTGEIAEFKKGGFHLALNSKATILPVRINGTNKIWPRGNMFNLRSGKVDFIVGEKIPYSHYKDKDVSELAIELRAIIESLEQ